MPRFDRYLLAQLLIMFGFFALVLVLVQWVNRAVVLFDRLIANGHSAMVFLEFSALSLPSVIGNVLPIASFAAAVYVANRLASDSELVVVQSTGFSPFRLARPVLVFGVFVGLMLALLTNFLIPASKAQLRYRQVEIRNNATARLLHEGRFLHPSPGVSFYVGRIGSDGALENIFLSDRREPGGETAFSARSAVLANDGRGIKLIMFDGMAQRLDTGTNRLATTRFGEFVFDLGALLHQTSFTGVLPSEMRTRDLLRPDSVVESITGQSAEMLRREGHWRFSLPALAVVTSLIGFGAILAGGFSRFSLWKQVAMAIGLLIALKSVDNLAFQRATSWPGGWILAYLAPALGLALAGALLWLSDRPALAAFRRRMFGRRARWSAP